MQDTEAASIPRPDVTLQNPLLARATVTDRSDGTATASSRPLTEGVKPLAKRPAKPGKVPLEKGYSQLDWMRLQRSHEDIAGLKGGSVRKGITMAEVKNHCTVDDAWTVLRGKVYNITPYMRFHPGGIPQLQRGAGIDCTALFLKYHAWVNADMMLERCLVGYLAQ